MYSNLAPGARAPSLYICFRERRVDGLKYFIFQNKWHIQMTFSSRFFPSRPVFPPSPLFSAPEVTDMSCTGTPGTFVFGKFHRILFLNTQALFLWKKIPYKKMELKIKWKINKKWKKKSKNNSNEILWMGLSSGELWTGDGTSFFISFFISEHFDQTQYICPLSFFFSRGLRSRYRLSELAAEIS